MQKRVFIFGIFLFFLISFVSAAEQDVFVLNLRYDNGNVSVQSLIVSKGFFNEPLNQPEEGYRLEVVSSKGKVLYEQKFEFSLKINFEPPPEWFDDEGNQIYFPTEEETEITTNTSTVELIFPYFKNIESINVYDRNDELVSSIDVGGEDFGEKSGSRYVVVFGIIVLIVVVFLVIFLIYRNSQKKNFEVNNQIKRTQ